MSIVKNDACCQTLKYDNLNWSNIDIDRKKLDPRCLMMKAEEEKRSRRYRRINLNGKKSEANSFLSFVFILMRKTNVLRMSIENIDFHSQWCIVKNEWHRQDLTFDEKYNQYFVRRRKHLITCRISHRSSDNLMKQARSKANDEKKDLSFFLRWKINRNARTNGKNLSKIVIEKRFLWREC